MDSRLVVRARVENLVVIRHFVQQTAHRLGADSRIIPDLVQAVDELAANSILHGYQGREGTVEIEMERVEARIIVRLRDQAPPFDTASVKPPDLSLPLEERPLGGMGIYLAKAFTDSITWRPMPQGGNELTLIKQAFPNAKKEETNEDDG